MNRTPTRVYSRTDVDHARIKGQVVGWIQDAVVAIAGWFLLGILGWLPVLIVVGIVGVLAVKMLLGKKE